MNNENIVTFGPITYIRGSKGGRYPFCNSLFIESAGIVIDPSSDRRALEQLTGKVQSVWLSHWHEDHIMFLDLFPEAKLAMHAMDAPPLEDIEVFIDWYGMDEQSRPHLRDAWRNLLVEQFNYKPRSVSYHLEQGQKLDLGGLTVEVIHAPGHSPGSLSFYFVEPEILFLGDYDLTSFGPWYGDLYSNIDQIIESVNRLRKTPAKTWLTGHEHGIFETDPLQTWDDYLNVIFRREQKLFDFLEQPRTIEEIGKAWIVYGKPIKPLEEFLMIEQISMQKHAERLIRKGMVEFDGKRYHRT